MMDQHDQHHGTRSEASQHASARCAATAEPIPTLPAFNAASYRTHLEPLALEDEQERALLETLWSIMYGFVELGFRVDVCAAVFDEQNIVADHAAAVVDSSHSTLSEASNIITEDKTT